MRDQPARSSATLLGVGRMGAAIAERLLGAGMTLTVWNRSPGRTEALERAGATVVDDPVDAVSDVPIVVTSLTDGHAVVDLMVEHQVVAAMSGATLVDCSTIGLAASRQLASACACHGIGYVRAPISGNPAVVRAGSATLLVSGAAGDIRRCQPVLQSIGGSVKVLGDHDEARVIKLAINLVLAGTAQLLAEAVIVAETGGVQRAVLLDALNDSVVGSAFSRYKSTALVAHDYTATFSTVDLAKDVDLVLAEAAAGDVKLPIAERLRELLQAAVRLGFGGDDLISLLPALQHASGLSEDP